MLSITLMRPKSPPTCLIVSIRESFGAWEEVDEIPVQLSRLEWRSKTNHRTDLVLVKPGWAKYLRESWGTVRSKVAKQLPLLAAVEVKRGAGEVPDTDSVCSDLAHLERVQNDAKFGEPIRYMLVWIDSDMKEDNGDPPSQRDKFQDVASEREQWCKDSPQPRRACCSAGITLVLASLRRIRGSCLHFLLGRSNYLETARCLRQTRRGSI